jgi:hypothetical protein
MDFNENQPTEMFETEDRGRRVDLRRVVVCFGVCLSAAAAIFVVAGADGGTDGDAVSAAKEVEVEVEDPASVDETVDDEATAPDRPNRPERSERSERGSGNGLCEFLGDRAENFFACRQGASPATPASGAGEAQPEGEAPGLTTSSSRIAGREVSLRHPADWVVHDQGDDGFVVAEPEGATAVSVVATRPPVDPWEEVVEAYLVLARRDLASDAELLEHGPMESNGREGYRIKISGTSDGMHFESDAWILIDGDQAWVVTLMHHAGDDRSRADATAVAETFDVAQSA